MPKSDQTVLLTEIKQARENFIKQHNRYPSDREERELNQAAEQRLNDKVSKQAAAYRAAKAK